MTTTRGHHQRRFMQNVGRGYRSVSFRRRWCTAAVAASLVVAACGSPTTVGSSATNATLTIAIPGAPLSLDPSKGGLGPNALGFFLAYEPLIRANIDGSFSPGLATRWNYTGSGNTEFQMTLRQGATFSDGTLVDAAAVKATIEYYLTHTGIASIFLDGVTAVDAPDSSTVVIHLNKPNPNLPEVFSQATGYGDIISAAGLKNPEELTTKTFGAGAYQLDPAATVPGDRYTYIKNPKYWNPSAQHYDKVVAKVISDSSSSFRALQTRQINVDLLPSPAQVGQAKSAELDATSGSPGNSVVIGTYLMDRAGQTVPALGKQEVREALNYATDRTSIAKALDAGYFTPTGQTSAMVGNGYDPALDSAYSYDPEKAKSLLTQAGYPDGFNMDVLTWDFAPYASTLVQALAQQWKAIGVNVTLKNDGSNSSQFVSDAASGKYPALLFNFASGGMFNVFQNIAAPGSGYNPFHSEDPAITNAFNTLATAPENEQNRAAQALNKELVEKAWFAPVISLKGYILSQGVANPGGWGGAGGGIFPVLDWQPK